MSTPFSPEKLDEREEPRPRQPLDLGQPNLTRTLLSLSERAEVASGEGGPLDRLAKEAAGQGGPGCTVELSGVKGFKRAFEKAHKEYGGDFLMLNDMARCTIICPKLTTLAECLRWLIEDAQEWAKDDEDLPSFEPLMIKDRLSPSFDAEGNGMYRYVLIVGRMACDGATNINIEIQLHTKRLFEAKKKLHMLYDGRKSVGAFDEAICKHEGELTKAAIDRASKGIITKIACPEGAEAISAGTREGLATLLQSNPCALTELNLAGSKGLDGVELGDGLLLPPGGGALTCVRLRSIRLSKCKLGGEIPKALHLCAWLQTLELQDNWLRGAIPEALGKCTALETLALHGNALSGEVPCTALACLTRLGMLTLGGELGGNDDLTIARSGAAALKVALADAELYLPKKLTEDGGQIGATLAADAEQAAAAQQQQADQEQEETWQREEKKERLAKQRTQAQQLEEVADAAREEVEAKKRAAAAAEKAKAAAEQAAKDAAAAEQAAIVKRRDEVLAAAAMREAEERRVEAEQIAAAQKAKKSEEELEQRRIAKLRAQAKAAEVATISAATTASEAGGADGADPPAPLQKRKSKLRKWPPDPNENDDDATPAPRAVAGRQWPPPQQAADVTVSTNHVAI